MYSNESGNRRARLNKTMKGSESVGKLAQDKIEWNGIEITKDIVK